MYPVTKNNIFGIILNNSNVFLFSISGRQKKRPLLDAKKVSYISWLMNQHWPTIQKLFEKFSISIVVVLWRNFFVVNWTQRAQKLDDAWSCGSSIISNPICHFLALRKTTTTSKASTEAYYTLLEIHISCSKIRNSKFNLRNGKIVFVVLFYPFWNTV